MQANGLVCKSPPLAKRRLKACYTVPALPGTDARIALFAAYIQPVNKPYFSRTPFIGGFFRNRADWRHQSLSRFNVTVTPEIRRAIRCLMRARARLRRP